MTPLEAVREIIADCERDVVAIDGKPLTGANVAQWFAETLAMIQALALIVEPLLEHQHTYFMTEGVGMRAYTTDSQRDIVNPNQKVFEAQAAAKLAAKKETP